MKIKIAIKGAAFLMMAGIASYLQSSFQTIPEVVTKASLSQSLEPPSKRIGVNIDVPTDEKKPSNSQPYWENYPNTSESFGKSIEESGPRIFLNTSQLILKKALKSTEDMEELRTLFSSPETYQTILKHYDQLPDRFYFVEEATRVKMLNFLIAAMELGGEWREMSLPLARHIAGTNLKEIRDPGLAQSIAGDVLRILGATIKYDRAAYEKLRLDLEDRKINSKILAYFERTKSGE